ncbi:MAG TPA: nuclear transport factor 2 family protein [Spongiibacteraceae bacterium]|nr:nuclear transport factor 2 family protein [Spongiibacteraceae bacterium]
MSQDAAIQALLDKQAIHELINAYCNAADRHDHEKMRSLYHEDAIDDHGSFFKGLAMEFIDRLPEIQKPMKILHHNVTTVNIKLDGDRAEGEVYILAFHQVDTESGPFDLLIGGRYFDKYEKRAGVWKFAHRAVVADWANLHNPSIVNLDNPVIEGAYIGKPGEADPSYGFYSLLKRGQR